MNTLTKWWCGFAISLCSLSLSAQGLECQDKQSIEECAQALVYDHVNEVRRDVSVEKTGATVKAASDKAVESDQPGVVSSGSQARSTVTDLLPWFDMLGLLSDSDASDGTIAADLNFLMPWHDEKKTKNNSQLKWQLDVSPEPSEDLIAAIPEDVRDERKKELEDDISDTADSELQFTYSVVNGRLGRDFRRHYGRLAALIAPVVLEAGPAAEREVAREARSALDNAIFDFLEEINAGRAESDEFDASTKIEKLNLTEERRNRLEGIIRTARKNLVPAMAARFDSMQSALQASGVNDLTRLVLLQPQLLFSANRRFRDEVVGPDDWGFKVTYERSFVSLNDFFDNEGSSCPGNANFSGSEVLKMTDVEPCLDKLRDYMKSHAEQIENESRWKASLEYKKTDHWEFSLPDDGVALDRPKFDRIIASAGFGRAIPRSAAKDRVDFEASYDSNLDNDDSYKSRLVVTLTYTRRIGEMDVPFSVVYANKSEFLEGTDKQIGVHIGLRFRGLEAQ